MNNIFFYGIRNGGTQSEAPEEPPPPQSGTVNRLYVLAGQSNMDGRGTIAELPAEMTGQFPNQYVWVNPGNFWAKIEPGVYNGTLNSNTTRVGPLIPFAYYEGLKYPNDTLYFVIYAQGGTSLTDDWLPPSGPAYTKFIDVRYDLAMAALPDTIDVRTCFIWYQGESDSQTVANSSAYYELEYNFFNAVMTHTDLDLVLDIKISTSYPYNSVVNQAKIDNALRVNSILIETADLNPTSELHLTTAQLIQLGERLSNAL